MSAGRIGVVGAGTMGAGIAQVCAASGLNVILYDTQAEALTRGVKSIENSLSRIVKKGNLTEEEKQAALERITTTSDAEALGGADTAVAKGNESNRSTSADRSGDEGVAGAQRRPAPAGSRGQVTS